jgi:two-component system, cell cycle sensor histidine kinase and response regulator CckA
MEAVGRLAGGVAHDFNNLLTVILGHADLLLGDLASDDDRRSDVTEIKQASERAAGLTRQLLAYSRKQVLKPSVLDLNEAVAAMDTLLRSLIGENVQLSIALAPALGAIEADRGQLEQVIMNLAVNARDAMPSGGKLTIETANLMLYQRDPARPELLPGPYVVLTVSDTGIGMDQSTKSHLFEPFFTTKEQGKGTGLGLATVYGIVKQSGGFIWAESEPELGARFTIYLPRVASAIPAAAVPSLASSLSGSETILVVEDEPGVRKLTCRALSGQGYTILRAECGEEALRVSDEYEGTIHLLVTDVVMPGMAGPELVKRLAAVRPETKVLYLSGYTDDSIVHHGMLEPGIILLQKPFTPQSLVHKVREVLT